MFADQQVALLSAICDDYSYNQLRAMSPSISEYLIKLARKQKKQGNVGLPPSKCNIVRHKLDMEKASNFFSFLFDHGYIQIMSWGTLKMQFSSGETATFGKVILEQSRSQLVRLYLQDCAARIPPYETLHERTLFRLLETVKFSERHAMAGIDNVACAAMEGWKSLEATVQKFHEFGLSKDTVGHLTTALKKSKNYLKGQYFVDVAQETSNCFHHCRRWALSDPKNKALSTPCDHQHEVQCVDCELLHSTINAIGEYIENLPMSEEERRELNHDFQIASDAIIEQKAHIIRGVHQEAAKQSIISNLDECTGLLIFDFAMKFLPVRYREAQADFFGKKGISWSVFSFSTRQNGEITRSTYGLFISKCDQNAATSAALYRYVLEQIKKDYPRITKIYDKSDNAAYYRNWKMLRERRRIMNDVGIQVVETHNNEPQRGKDQADRDVAMIKTQLRAYHNSGGDIISAKDMKTACATGALSATKTAVVSCHLNRKAPKQKVPRGPAITSLHSFRYEETGVRCWHFNNIGEGVLIPYKEMPSVDHDQRFVVIQQPFPDTPRKEREANPPELPSHNATTWLYCNYPYCHKKFLSPARHEEHQMNYDHSSIRTAETTSDQVKQLWLKLQEFHESVQVAATASASASATIEAEDVSDPCPQGFALKVRRAPKRLNDKQKKYLADLFWKGQTGASPKAIPEAVAEEMRDQTIFSPAEWLTQAEIQRFFSKMAVDVRAGKIGAPQFAEAGTITTMVPGEEGAEDNEDSLEMYDAETEDYAAIDNAILEHEMHKGIDDITGIDGTLALEVGDYCAVGSPSDWNAARVCSIDSEKGRLEVQLFQKTKDCNKSYETSNDLKMLINVEDVMVQLPKPILEMTGRRAGAREIMAFPKDLCDGFQASRRGEITQETIAVTSQDQPTTSRMTLRSTASKAQGRCAPWKDITKESDDFDPENPEHSKAKQEASGISSSAASAGTSSTENRQRVRRLITQFQLSFL